MHHASSNLRLLVGVRLTDGRTSGGMIASIGAEFSGRMFVMSSSTMVSLLVLDSFDECSREDGKNLLVRDDANDELGVNATAE